MVKEKQELMHSTHAYKCTSTSVQYEASVQYEVCVVYSMKLDIN